MKLKYPGVPVYMNGQNYYVPSLSFRNFKDNYEMLRGTPETEGPKLIEYFEKMIPVIGGALRRNYPEVSDHDLEEWLDLHTLALAIRAVQGASGLTPVSEGE